MPLIDEQLTSPPVSLILPVVLHAAGNVVSGLVSFAYTGPASRGAARSIGCTTNSMPGNAARLGLDQVMLVDAQNVVVTPAMRARMAP